MAGVTQATVKSKTSWRFAGEASLAKADLGDYGLTQVSGPVEAAEADGQWDIKARLAGAGGHGAGYAAAMLGAVPKASLDASKLADGRLLLRDLQVVGAGLKVEASGARSLLGGLTFKGKAAVSNLAAAHPGAAGSAQANWSAGQARAGQPWTFSLDAQGDKLATGYPEIDRLLGPKPGLKAQASLLDRRLTVASASLNGAALNASTSGAGVLDRRSLALASSSTGALDGPFRAGPAEVAGKAKGTGTVAGTLDELARGAAGRPGVHRHAAATAEGRPRDAEFPGANRTHAQRAVAALCPPPATTAWPARAPTSISPAGGIDLTGLSVDAGGVKASGALSLRSRAPSAADLDVAVTRGAFLDAGRVSGTVKITGAPAAPHAALNLTAENVRAPGAALTITSARLSADGPLSRLPYAGQAAGTSEAGPWSVNGRGGSFRRGPAGLYACDLRRPGPARRPGSAHAGDRSDPLRGAGAERTLATRRLRRWTDQPGRPPVRDRHGHPGAGGGLRTLGLIDEDLISKHRRHPGAAGPGRASRRDAGRPSWRARAGRGAPAASSIDGTLHRAAWAATGPWRSI